MLDNEANYPRLFLAFIGFSLPGTAAWRYRAAWVSQPDIGRSLFVKVITWYVR